MKTETIVIIVVFVLLVIMPAWWSHLLLRNWRILVEHYATFIEPTCDAFFRRQHLNMLFPDGSRYAGPMHIGISAIGLFLKPTIEQWPRFRPILIPWDKIRAVTTLKKYKNDSFQQRQSTHYIVPVSDFEVICQLNEIVRSHVDRHVQQITIDER